MKNQEDGGIFANNLRRVMRMRRTNVPLVAEQAGLHENTIYNWLNHGIQPTAVKLMAVARVLKCPMDEFFKEGQA